MKQNKGLSIHCHHDTLIECCTNYQERIDYIKNEKPINEQEIRLKVFKLLSKEAIEALPKNLIKATIDWEKADADREKAYADWEKAYDDRKKAYADRKKADADWEKADADWEKADADREKAYADWKKAYADWKKAYAEKWHKKFCGCSYWNGEKLVFEMNKAEKR